MTTYTRLTVPGVIVFSTIGSLIGALILYRVGLELNRGTAGACDGKPDVSKAWF